MAALQTETPTVERIIGNGNILGGVHRLMARLKDLVDFVFWPATVRLGLPLNDQLEKALIGHHSLMGRNKQSLRPAKLFRHIIQELLERLHSHPFPLLLISKKLSSTNEANYLFVAFPK